MDIIYDVLQALNTVWLLYQWVLCLCRF